MTYSQPMKDALMDHQLAVLIQTAVGGGCVCLLVTGCLTDASQEDLYPLIRRARMLVPPATITVDLTAAEHVKVTGVDLLRWAVDHDGTLGGVEPVEIVLPDQLPNHPPAPVRMTHHLRGPGWSPA